jgi:histidyl-tRNA synthetase
MISIVKGTKDILDAAQWQFMERTALEIFSGYGYGEIRTPILEHTELFSRGVGDTTDIVNKEMYTFEKSDRSLTLRPEGTAGVVRSFIENGMHRLSPPVKLWYKGAMFRYERPQAGRQRQFSQVGAELFGVAGPAADAEVILLALDYLKALGLPDLEVELNSLGCSECRDAAKNAIRAALKPDELCEDCQKRYDKNPLRLLDCKVCKISVELPDVCSECAAHFDEVKALLNARKVKYSINKMLVRGLDYYNRTVFEIKSNALGSQNAVCGGGRYDSLVKTLGGADTPAVGWAMGMERLASLLPAPEPKKSDVYIISDSAADAFALAAELRDVGISAETDLAGKKIGKQLEKAAKTVNYALFLGEEIGVKNLTTGEQVPIPRQNLISYFQKNNNCT